LVVGINALGGTVLALLARVLARSLPLSLSLDDDDDDDDDDCACISDARGVVEVVAVAVALVGARLLPVAVLGRVLRSRSDGTVCLR
jgi:hypothetical protein